MTVRVVENFGLGILDFGFNQFGKFNNIEYGYGLMNCQFMPMQ